MIYDTVLRLATKGIVGCWFFLAVLMRRGLARMASRAGRDEFYFKTTMTVFCKSSVTKDSLTLLC